ncbi:MAG: AAA family ATPase, partial [Hyphomicrobiales bacterium]|nr:AAA family ATPase [Hyphomicrobiales bacterium]
DGRIELAWTDGRDGRLRHAALFGTDELDQLVARALGENRKPGQNIYVGQALRKPGTSPVGRCKDEDFLALTAFYVDVDDDVTATAAVNYRHRGCPPTAVVVTGRHPHVRAQMLWRLKAPERDALVCRAQNLALAETLGGDTTVVNPSRVMRLGGSIAWPLKEGRVIERTEFLTFDDGRPKTYLPEQIATGFPPAQPLLGSTPVTTEVPADAASPSRTELKIGSGVASVETCVALIRAGDHWHDNLVRLTGHWIARGWSDAEIITAAEALTLPGYTIGQTRHEVAAMIAGGRRKWGIENPTHAVEDAARSTIDLLAWTADRYAGEARPIAWLCRGTIPLGVPVLLAAMGGLGKSYLALDLALQIAAGVAGLEQVRKILGGRIAVEGTAAVVTAEDSFDAVHRRLNRIDPTSRRLRHPKRLIVLPLPDAGGVRPLVASDGKTLARTPFFNDFKEQLLRLADLRLVVIDPLQAFVLADVNADPAAAQFLWSAVAELAAATGATVLLTHHMRKDGMLRIADGDDAREAIRGTTALVDGARLAYALWKLDDEAARPICNTLAIPFARGCIVRGAVVKANDEGDHNAHTYVRQESGLLAQLETEPGAASEPEFTITQAREVLKEIERRFAEGSSPFSHATQAGSRYLGTYLMRQYRMTKKAATDLITDWLNNGIVGIEICNRKKNLMGLKVLQWL